MLVKEKDDVGPQLRELDKLLRLPLSSRQRAEIEREKTLIKWGSDGEKAAAYQIDFSFKPSKKWMIIHDLRFEYKGRTAQIDHLAFFPCWDFYIIETKNICTKVKIEDGQWCYLQKNHWRGMANPIEQNGKHIEVLKQVLHDFDWLPRRLGVPVVSRFINVVLLPPGCLIQKEDDCTWVTHMDEFVTKARKDFTFRNALLNVIHPQTAKDAYMLAQKLVAMHCPWKPDYRKRFGVVSPESVPNKNPPFAEGNRCSSCGGEVNDAEARYCQINRTRFAGKLLCKKCQRYAPAVIHEASLPPTKESPGTCANCGASVSRQVIAYCNRRRRRFANQILCPSCQKPAAANQFKK